MSFMLMNQNGVVSLICLSLGVVGRWEALHFCISP